MYEDFCELKKSDYFKNGEDVFIHRSDNSDFNGITHKHNFIELVYVISGKAIHKIGDMSYPVKKGNVVMVDYGIPHSFSFDSDSEQGFVTYDLLFTPAFYNLPTFENNEFFSLASSYLFSSIFAELDSQQIPQNLVKSNSRDFHALFDKIYMEYTEPQLGSQNIIRAYLMVLIIKILREIVNNRPAFTQSHRDLVNMAINHMKENYRSHISLDEIVSGMFLSKNYFRQIFKKTTGTSISSYIQELRINEACHLLETTLDNSSVIAEKCGFNDIKFFYHTFKKAMGMTPSEYRQKKLMEN